MRRGQESTRGGASAASDVYKRQVENGTLSAGIYARLGQLALAAGELSVADSHLRLATELLPSLAPAWWSWGLAAERAGNAVAAVERIGRSVELNPGDASARLYLGRLLAAVGRDREARRMLEEAARVGAGSEAGREAERLLAGGDLNGSSGSRRR